MPSACTLVRVGHDLLHWVIGLTHPPGMAPVSEVLVHKGVDEDA